MSSLTQSVLDRVYLVYFLIHIPVLFCVDLVPLYPRPLWEPSNAPLRVLGDLRTWYAQTYNDQFFQPPPTPIPNFFPLYAFFELIFHLPVSLWAVGSLWRHSGVRSGGAELLLLVYGLQTALTTLTCVWEAALWDPEIVTFEQKKVVIGGLYGGYLALAVIMTIDMYARVLKRMKVADAVKKAQ
ncbi:transmembrane protein 6/97 [Xylaria sp. FL0933]|nr:transmembrane protein 6/97 [Xylaria sp. FL0933]